MKLKISTLRSLVLYDYRYVFAYAAVFLFSVYFLCWRLGSLVPGIGQPELETAARSIQFEAFLHRPLYPLHSLLQWASLNLFDVTTISLRLPGVLIAAATLSLLYILLKRWFGKVTSLVAIALLASADWFLFVARLGTGAIEFSLWLTLLIFSLMKLIERKTNWIIGYSVAAAMLLFTPYGIYALIPTTVCLFACSMFRTRALKASLWTKLLSLFIIAIAIGLATFASLANHSHFAALIGTVQLPVSFSDYAKNLVINTSGVFMIWPDNNPLIGPHGIFLVRFFEFAFMLFGLIMLWRTRVNRLNVVVIANAIVLAFASGLSAGSRGGGLLVVPAAICMTAGLRHYIHRWERTFPKNPYAKLVLFISLIILTISTTLLHYQTYFALWPRQSATRATFSQDYELLASELKTPGFCTVIGANAATKQLLTYKKSTCETSFGQDKKAIAVSSENRIITKNTAQEVAENTLVRPLVTSTREDNVRWLVTTVE